MKFETLSKSHWRIQTVRGNADKQTARHGGMPVWRKSFYDCIVRNDHEMHRIQEYVPRNPIKWAEDRDNPMNPTFDPPAKSMNDYWKDIFEVQM